MIEMGKQYKTRDGREVRIYAVDAGGDESVHGAVRGQGEWGMESWNADGSYYGDTEEDRLDLIEVKPEYTRWMVCASNYGYATQDEARRAVKQTYGLDDIAVVPVTFREGDGL